MTKYQNLIQKNPRIKFSKNQNGKLDRYVENEKALPDGRVRGGYWAPDEIIVDFFNKFVRNKHVDLNAVFTELKRTEFNRSRELLPAALFTLCQRTYKNDYFLGVGLKKEERNPVDFQICYIPLKNKEDAKIVLYQQVVIPNILLEKPISERIDKAVQIIKTKFNKYPRYDNPLNLLVVSQIFFKTQDRHRIYRLLKNDLINQQPFNELWFLFFNGQTEDSDFEVSAERVLPDGKVYIYPAHIKKELDKFDERKHAWEKDLGICISATP